jgi:hypothetical protein
VFAFKPRRSSPSSALADEEGVGVGAEGDFLARTSASPGPSKLEAVRLARERLGEAPAQEMAACVQASFGIRLEPAIVAVLPASLRERECLEQSKRRALESAGKAGTG